MRRAEAREAVARRRRPAGSSRPRRRSLPERQREHAAPGQRRRHRQSGNAEPRQEPGTPKASGQSSTKAKTPAPASAAPWNRVSPAARMRLSATIADHQAAPPRETRRADRPWARAWTSPSRTERAEKGRGEEPAGHRHRRGRPRGQPQARAPKAAPPPGSPAPSARATTAEAPAPRPMPKLVAVIAIGAAKPRAASASRPSSPVEPSFGELHAEHRGQREGERQGGGEQQGADRPFGHRARRAVGLRAAAPWRGRVRKEGRPCRRFPAA